MPVVIPSAASMETVKLVANRAWFSLTINGSCSCLQRSLVNGRQISQDRLPDEMVVEKVHIGAASIGNWSEPERQDPHFAVRNLNGAIDEFAIFSTALTTDEIEKLYEQGRP